MTHAANMLNRFIDPLLTAFQPAWAVPALSIALGSLNELHPTQKPVELIERAFENSSRAGDLE